MKTAFFHGLQNPRNTYWMGQAEPSLGQQADQLLPLLTAGATAFGGYETAQAQEDARKAAEAQKAAAASNAQAAATNAAATNAVLNSKKILGLDPGMFWGGLAAIGVLTAVGVVVANKKK